MAYAALGDVTTPTGSGPGLFSQIAAWFTGSTANAANSPQIVLDWMADVRSRGNAVVRYPKTDDIGTQGDLAERETLDGGCYSYYLAPVDVINADRITRGLSLLAPATAKIAAVGENITSGISDEIKHIALLTGAALIAVEVLPQLLRKR